MNGSKSVHDLLAQTPTTDKPVDVEALKKAIAALIQRRETEPQVIVIPPEKLSAFIEWINEDDGSAD